MNCPLNWYRGFKCITSYNQLATIDGQCSIIGNMVNAHVFPWHRPSLDKDVLLLLLWARKRKILLLQHEIWFTKKKINIINKEWQSKLKVNEYCIRRYTLVELWFRFIFLRADYFESLVTVIKHDTFEFSMKNRQKKIKKNHCISAVNLVFKSKSIDLLFRLLRLNKIICTIFNWKIDPRLNPDLEIKCRKLFPKLPSLRHHLGLKLPVWIHCKNL